MAIYFNGAKVANSVENMQVTDFSKVTACPEFVVKGKRFYDVTGQLREGTLESYGAQEAQLPTISGVWVFNESIQFPDTSKCWYFPVNFTIGGTACNLLALDTGDGLYAVPTSAWQPCGDLITVWYQGSYTYETIDFGDEPQEVTTEFLEWIEANAHMVQDEQVELVTFTLGYSEYTCPKGYTFAELFASEYAAPIYDNGDCYMDGLTVCYQGSPITSADTVIEDGGVYNPW